MIDQQSYNTHTKADDEIRECLKSQKSFVVIAGAGSGKTTSLVEALKYLRKEYGAKLLQAGQQIVCITYTNRAVDVISERVEQDDLFVISTLHKFLWNTIKNFTPNICQVLIKEIICPQIEKQKKDAQGQSKKAEPAQKKIAQLREDMKALENVDKFSYADSAFSNYAKGEIGHDDVIKIAAYLIEDSEILRRMIGQKFPYILVDEAQDTFKNINSALNKVCEGDGLPIIGYFGDPMQQIYDDRAGDFTGPSGFVTIKKENNFRSARAIIDLLNAFRKDIEQIPSEENKDKVGSVKLKIICSQAPQGKRNTYTDSQIEKALQNFEEVLEEWGWKGSRDAKRLFLTRQMIARRLGFSKLNKLFTGDYISKNAQDEYEKGEHFLLEPFHKVLFPLFIAYKDGDDNQYNLLNILKNNCPSFKPNGEYSTKTLREVQTIAQETLKGLLAVWETKKTKDILKYAHKTGLITMSERLRLHIDRSPREEEYNAELHKEDKTDWLADKFFNTEIQEIENFCQFVAEDTPYSTQHGVKGEEYKDVLVVFDDIEANWNNYNFSKIFSQQSSDTPQFKRTQNLAYVCFSRAIENLRIILFTSNPELSKQKLCKGIFKPDQVEIMV